jgi:molybdopterin/thiamine biosynthesis adenylyltransferase/nitroreductase
MSHPIPHFDPEEAFSRNVGWLSAWEQQQLRHKTVAIAGMGGVGGVHLETLVRLGIGRFHISDFDRFELANFNRQAGAATSTLGRPKAEVMTERALDINPQLDIRSFPEGVSEANVDAFLDGADLYVDGLDVFAVDARKLVFEQCAARGIPAITAAPIGMGVAYLYFAPGGMTFEDYFGWEGRDKRERLVRMVLGLGPRSPHPSYLVDRTRLDLEAGKAPSTPMACQLAAGVVGTEALKVLLRKETLKPAPYYHQFDAYRQVFRRGKLRHGHRSPLLAAKRWIALRSSPPVPAPGERQAPRGEVEAILDLARWAPSGDNHQPWRFERRGDDRVRVHLQVPSDDVYDLTGDATVLSGGFLLETMRVAASRFDRAMRWHLAGSEGSVRFIDVELPRAREVSQDPRADFIEHRSVDRRPYRLDRLTPEQKEALERALGDELEIRWLESLSERLSLARVQAGCTDIRLRTPEANEVHRRIIDFAHRQSTTGIPAPATGLDPLTLRMMRWAVQDFRRVRWVNATAGTGLPRVQMDLVPAVACAAQFLVAFRRPPSREHRETALLRAGMGLQRMWLEATRLGLALQPTFAPIAFGRYGVEGRRFTRDPDLPGQAAKVGQAVRALWPDKGIETLAFAGRLGTPQRAAPPARSVRRPLSELMIAPSSHVTEQPAAATPSAA